MDALCDSAHRCITTRCCLLQPPKSEFDVSYAPATVAPDGNREYGFPCGVLRVPIIQAPRPPLNSCYSTISSDPMKDETIPDASFAQPVWSFKRVISSACRTGFTSKRPHILPCAFLTCICGRPCSLATLRYHRPLLKLEDLWLRRQPLQRLDRGRHIIISWWNHEFLAYVTCYLSTSPRSIVQAILTRVFRAWKLEPVSDLSNAWSWADSDPLVAKNTKPLNHSGALCQIHSCPIAQAVRRQSLWILHGHVVYGFKTSFLPL